MSDRALLEAAARAAGLDYEYHFGGYSNDPEFNEFVAWNPLTDDGDALRLAVKLGLNVSRGYADSGIGGQYFFEADGDEYSATRRAIVRAAAALGADK